MKPSVSGRAELAEQPLGQKENHCGPSAAEGRAELLLLVSHSGPGHYCFCPAFVGLLIHRRWSSCFKTLAVPQIGHFSHTHSTLCTQYITGVVH